MFPWKSFRVVYRAGLQWSSNQDLRWGAGLAYYALFSLVPLLMIGLHIAGFFYGEVSARERLEHELTGLIGEEPARAVRHLLTQVGSNSESHWAPTISYLLLLSGAMGVFLHLRSALCVIWKLEPASRNSYLATLIDYALALIMVVCSGVLLLFTLVAGTVVAYVRLEYAHTLPLGGGFWQLVDLGMSVIVVALLITLIYRILSGRRIIWRHCLYGAFLASLLFTLGKFLISYYLVISGTVTAYGAAGSLVVILVWVYYSSQVLFFGAELIQARREINQENSTQQT